MMILTLTDHNTHGNGESIYSILKHLNSHANISVYVASRGVDENIEFFSDFSSEYVNAKIVDNEFSFTEDGSWFYDGDMINTNKFDVIFLRLDRPLSDEKLIALKKKFSDIIIINDPEGIIRTGSKRFLLNFPELCPYMRLVATVEDVIDEINKSELVLKPIFGYGGIGIVRVSTEGVWIGNEKLNWRQGHSELEKIFSSEGEMLAMSFLKNVDLGDKRVVIVGDKIVGATLRLPKPGAWLCNLKQGGSAAFSEPDEDEKNIGSKLIPIMKKHGVIIYGFDTLVNDDGKRVLSEINTLNVGGFLQAEEFSGRPITKIVADEVIKFCHQEKYSRT